MDDFSSTAYEVAFDDLLGVYLEESWVLEVTVQDQLSPHQLGQGRVVELFAGTMQSVRTRHVMDRCGRWRRRDQVHAATVDERVIAGGCHRDRPTQVMSDADVHTGADTEPRWAWGVHPFFT